MNVIQARLKIKTSSSTLKVHFCSSDFKTVLWTPKSVVGRVPGEEASSAWVWLMKHSHKGDCHFHRVLITFEN